MKSINERPENLTRVLVKLGNVYSFAFYKDGLFRYDGGSRWFPPVFEWMPIKDLHTAIELFDNK